MKRIGLGAARVKQWEGVISTFLLELSRKLTLIPLISVCLIFLIIRYLQIAPT
jgi:hypothetical protein